VAPFSEAGGGLHLYRRDCPLTDAGRLRNDGRISL